MPTISPHPSSSFWVDALVELLRVPVVFALRTRLLTSKDIIDLIKVATYRELKSRGYSNPEMAVLLGCTKRTVKNWGRLSAALQGQSLGAIPLDRLLEQLKEGPVNEWDLAACFPVNNEYEVGPIAARMLERMGLLKKRSGRRGGFVLTDSARRLTPDDWKTPLSEVEVIFGTALAVLLFLAAGQTSEDKIFAWAESEGRELTQISAALDLLLELGEIEEFEQEDSTRYTLARPLQRLQPRSAKARKRVGLLYMFEHLRSTMESAVDAQGLPFHQGSAVIQASPERLRGMARALSQWVNEKILEVEQASEGADDARPFSMLWVFSAFGRRH